MCVTRICLLTLVSLTLVSWGNASQSQYHIQTDEGPERYFRFQTDNGQFRKEKRLQDGTVIGTEAWIDAAGFLRQKDYIADKQGYRILKSKTIFVGQGRGIEDAIKSTKAAPAQSGVLVDGNAGGNSIASSSGSGYQKAGYVYASTTTTTTTPAPAVAIPLEYEQSAILASGVGKLNYLPPEQAAQIEPQTQLGFDHYPDELPRARDQLLSVSPVVHIQPNSEPLDELPNAINVYDEEADRAFGHGQFGSVISSTTTTTTTTTPRPTSLYTPSLDMLPPAFSSHRRRLRPRPRPSAIAIVASTPSPISSQEAFAYSTPKPFAAPPPQFPLHVDTGYQYVTPPTVSGYSPLEVNSLDTAPALLPPLPDRAYRRRLRPVHSNHLDSAAEYDGVSVNRNGFRYVLPKQYHEEQQIGEKRAGSFGYVDPFGIRRVVYYNASPGRGFVHRNNNQFVGANGAPYDEPGPAQLVNE